MLAVLLTVVSLIAESLREDPDTVAAEDETDVPGDAPVEEPRLVEVRCDPTGIVIPVASVRAQIDGLHLRVLNSLPGPTHVMVTSNEWDSGEIPIGGPSREFVQPVPPGVLAIGCEIDGEYQRRRVDLVDPGGFYEEPALACDAPEQPALRDLPVPPTPSLVMAVRQGLGDRIKDGDYVGAVKGYDGQDTEEFTKDPQAAVMRDDEMVARVHVRGADGSANAPFTSISLVEACPNAFATTSTTSTTAATTPTSAPAV